MLAGRHSVGEHAQDIVTVVMGAPGGASRVAQQDAYALYASAKRIFVSADSHVGAAYRRYVPAWSEAIPVLAKESLGMFVWSGTPIGLQLPSAEMGLGSQDAGVLTVSRASGGVTFR